MSSYAEPQIIQCPSCLTRPPLEILPPPEHTKLPVGELAQTLTQALRGLGVGATVVQCVAGPSTVSFELEPRDGVTMREFTRLDREKDIAYALGAETVRIQAPIPGKHRVGIEIPSPKRRTVALSEVAYCARPPLVAGLGVTPDLQPLTLDIAALPHLIVAGASGSGKSSLLHAMLCSLLMRCRPDQLQLVLVDTKRVELTPYRGIPHLLRPVIVEADEAVAVLESLVDEVERRYMLLEQEGARDIGAYRARGRRLPNILCVIDEFADLMMQSRKRVEAAVTRLGQLGRACGVHLVLGTQSPHATVLSGLIKANIPARIALRVASGVHSRVAIDQGGAETLLGHGDALLQDGQGVGLQRFQSAFVPAELLEQIVAHWKSEPELEQGGPRRGTALLREGGIRDLVAR